MTTGAKVWPKGAFHQQLRLEKSDGSCQNLTIFKQLMLRHQLGMLDTALLLTAWSGASMPIGGDTAHAGGRSIALRASSHGMKLASPNASPDSLSGPGYQLRLPRSTPAM